MATEALNLYPQALEHRYRLGLITGCELAQAKRAGDSGDQTMSATAQAKDTLLRALDQLEKAESDLEATPERADLVVVYSTGKDMGDGAWQEVGGWSATAGPKWLHAAMAKDDEGQP